VIETWTVRALTPEETYGLKKNEPQHSCPLLPTGLEEKTMEKNQGATSLYNTRLCNWVIYFQGYPRHISMQRRFLIPCKAISSVNQNVFIH